MTLTNQNLIVLSKFAIKVKKHIDLVKAAEMLNDKQYACDILAQATLSNSQELVDLKKINDSFGSYLIEKNQKADFYSWHNQRGG